MREQLSFTEKLQGHKNRNTELLANLRAKNVPLDQPRAVELHFWANGQASAAQLSFELYKQGYIVLRLAPADVKEDPQRWNVEAGTKLSPDQLADEVLIKNLINLATLCSGVFDGWGTSV
jgi:regulator of RNase E activity RraB